MKQPGALQPLTQQPQALQPLAHKPRGGLVFHSATQLINTVHRVEASFNLPRAGRAVRLAVTVADQAIQGEGSVRFAQKECTMGNLPVRPLAEGVCKFHITAGVGSNVDKLYGGTFAVARLL